MKPSRPQPTAGFRKLILQGLGLLGVAALWQMASSLGHLSEHLFPSPWYLLQCWFGFVFGTGWKSPYAGQFWLHGTVSLLRVVAGFSLASSLGIVMGVLCARVQILAMLTDPLVQFVRSIPGIAWLPIAMVWFGIGTQTTLFLISLAAFFPVYVNTFHGVREVPIGWIHAALTLGANRGQMIGRVILPAAWPSIQTGLRLAMGISWAYVVLGELTGVNTGLGAMIMDARMMGDVPVMLVGMVSIALLGRLSDLILMYGTGLLWKRVA